MNSLILPAASNAKPNVECAKCGTTEHYPVLIDSPDIQLCWRCKNKECREVNITSVREDDERWTENCKSCNEPICSRRLFDLPLAVKEHDGLCLACCFIGWLVEKNKDRVLKMSAESKAKRAEIAAHSTPESPIN